MLKKKSSSVKPASKKSPSKIASGEPALRKSPSKIASSEPASKKSPSKSSSVKSSSSKTFIKKTSGKAPLKPSSKHSSKPVLLPVVADKIPLKPVINVLEKVAFPSEFLSEITLNNITRKVCAVLVVDKAFESENGMAGMQRDIILRLCGFLLLWDKSNEVKNIIGMGVEHYNWKNHVNFLRNRPIDLPINFRSNSESRYTLTPCALAPSIPTPAGSAVGTHVKSAAANQSSEGKFVESPSHKAAGVDGGSCAGVECVIRTGSASVCRTIFLDKVIKEGIFRWSLKISFGNNESVRFMLGAALADDHLGDFDSGELGNGCSGSCSFDLTRPHVVKKMAVKTPPKGKVAMGSANSNSSSNNNNNSSDSSNSNNLFECCMHNVCDDKDANYTASRGISLPTGSILALEVDAGAQTLSLFVNGKKHPRIITELNVPLHLGLTGFSTFRFTTLSFLRLPAPTPSPPPFVSLERCLSLHVNRTIFRISITFTGMDDSDSDDW